MAVLGKDLLDFRRPLTHTKVQFGEKLYWIEENSKGIPYGTVLTELLNYDAAAYIETVQQFRGAAERKNDEDVLRTLTALKEEFLKFLEALMEASPEIVEKYMSENVKTYIGILRDDRVKEKPVLTDGGKKILKYMQECGIPALKAKDIAEGLFISSRGVSGSLRKLVTDGFCDKVGQDPVVYTLTEKGKNFVIEEGENE